ncbi:hypothetical protein Nisw_07330 [Candidatus Nitrosopumilus sp. SW]|uniref:hypothetical protein n=1 Tax=Candidatus Nitrosopumilus sp. SW TaxID=2508726 RepID=UPI00114DA55D|nr:hypothetical protein [Candidatus Nitrosopumilus sp. SW]QDI89347.1 hypothetical protein Nisw_07330 [Candidatus Nitrosopumilus sp. SW]
MKSITFLVFFLGLILVSSTFTTQGFADVISPRQQMNLDFTSEQVICSEGLVKIIKKSNGNASCVKPATAEKLSQNGWANPLTEKKLDEIKMIKSKKGQPAGTINEIATVKQSTKIIKGTTTAGISGYSYIFEACAASKTVRSPEIFVTSDSETKHVKLAEMLKANSCYPSSVIIKAADPNSISATLLNKGGISEKISSLENQITDLKERITAAKQKIPKSGDQNPETLSDIVSLKKELKSLQDQLRRYLMVLYLPTSARATELDIPKSITGKPLDGMIVNLISVTESVGKPESSNPDFKRYDVVFEACAGNDPVRLPVITIVSDSTSTTVKLIDKIIPNSCQVGVAKINALDSNSIAPKISTNSGISDDVTKLETKIDQLQKDISDLRKLLTQLTSKKLDSAGEEKVTEIALNIAELRVELLETRAKLHALLLLV